MTEEATNLARHNLLFAVEKSMRYHQRQRGFFERIHRWVMFLIIASGSAIFVQLWPELMGLAAVVLAAGDLTIGFGMKAREHQLLFQKFAELNREIRRVSDPTPEQITQWCDQRLAIETEEPPTLWALEADCYNEVSRAWGLKPDHPVVLTWWQRLWMHVWPFESAVFDRQRNPATA